ncbi:MAG: amidohydrolase [Phycisphaerae bacterium]|nr:amidohydrolase [Phycisphaerae bacterium]
MSEQITDYFCFAGIFPFGQPGKFGISDLLDEMDADGIAFGYVTDIGSMFLREPSDANVAFIESCAAHSERLSPLPVIDLSTETFEKDIAAYSEMGVKGIRIAPNYHGYSLDESYCRRLIDILRERQMMLFLASQAEDVRFQSACLGVKALGLGEISHLVENSRGVRVVLNGFRASDVQNVFDSPPEHVFFDVSAFDSSFPSMETLIEQWGPSPFVYGSHVPILCRGASLCNLRKSLLSAENITIILQAIEEKQK